MRYFPPVAQTGGAVAGRGAAGAGRTGLRACPYAGVWRAVGWLCSGGDCRHHSLLRWVGAGRVALRYAERLFAHDAMFRALADLRVWFFHSLARGAAAGLGFRRAGDMLSRLVSDIGALDGLYLRIVLPLLCACLTFPALLIIVGRQSLLLGLGVGSCLPAPLFWCHG